MHSLFGLFFFGWIVLCDHKRPGDTVHQHTPNPKEGMRKAFHVLIYSGLFWIAWHDEAVALFVQNIVQIAGPGNPHTSACQWHCLAWHKSVSGDQWTFLQLEQFYNFFFLWDWFRLYFFNGKTSISVTSTYSSKIAKKQTEIFKLKPKEIFLWFFQDLNVNVEGIARSESVHKHPQISSKYVLQFK